MKNNDNASAFESYEYDEKIRKTLPYYDEFYKQIISVVKLMKNVPFSWLDIGCGTGRMADEVFREDIVLEHFTFLDNSKEMMDIVKQRHNKPISEFLNGSILEMNQKESFDVITAIQVFHYLSDEERVIAIKKCQNALRRQGVLFYFENFRPNNKEC